MGYRLFIMLIYLTIPAEGLIIEVRKREVSEYGDFDPGCGLFGIFGFAVKFLFLTIALLNGAEYQRLFG